MWMDAESPFRQLLKGHTVTSPWDGTNWNTGGFVDWQLVKIAEFIRYHTKDFHLSRRCWQLNSRFSFLRPKGSRSICPDEALFSAFRNDPLKLASTLCDLNRLTDHADWSCQRCSTIQEGFDFN